MYVLGSHKKMKYFIYYAVGFQLHSAILYLNEATLDVHSWFWDLLVSKQKLPLLAIQINHERHSRNYMHQPLPLKHSALCPDCI
jgi:hypothetical protein